MWTEELQKRLAEEIQADPLRRGYSTLTDAQVAEDMNLRIWSQEVGVGIDPWKIYHTLTHEELLAWYTAALTTPELRMMWELWQAALQANHPIDPVDIDMPGVVDATQRKTLLQRLFAAGKTANILTADTVGKVEALAPKRTRCEVLDIPVVTDGWVEWARRQSNG
jgi:hypothetical protein